MTAKKATAAKAAKTATKAIAPKSAPVQTAQLTSGDCQMILNIFDAAQSRGAFKGDEMSSVGQVYDKVKLVMTQTNAAAQAAEAAANADDAPADVAEDGASA